MTDELAGWRHCGQCRTPFQPGATFYRYMIAEHRNSETRPYISRRRALDILICQDCHNAVRNTLGHRRDLYLRQQRLEAQATDLAEYIHKREQS